MPLMRAGNGDLGVKVMGAGGGAAVVVNIYNQTDSKVEQKQSTNGQGQPQIDVMITKAVEKDIRRGGGVAQAISTLFGARPATVAR